MNKHQSFQNMQDRIGDMWWIKQHQGKISLSTFVFSSLPFHQCPVVIMFHLSAAIAIPQQLTVLLKMHYSSLDVQQEDSKRTFQQKCMILF
jgi:hypothetical protein